jgi:transposase
MKLHANAKLTPSARLLLCRRITEQGRSLAQAAEAAGVSERTARKWLARFRAEGAAGLENRSSRPTSVANRTAEPWIEMMERLRREYRLSAEEIGTKLHCARSTVAAWLKRRGLGRLKHLEAPAPVRAEDQRQGRAAAC